MASEQSRRLAELYESWNERRAANQNDPIGFLRSLFREWDGVGTEAPDVSYESADGPVPGIRAVPRDADPTAAILYVHGGGYIGGSPLSHRKLAGHLARAVGAPAFVVDYRLAPEHKYPAQLDDVRTAFDWLVDSGIAPGRIIVAGDSAGGALATALALQLRDDAAAAPGAVITISPYYDSEANGDSYVTNAGTDIMAGGRGRDGIRANISMIISEEEQRTSPYLSALRADVEGLPPHFITFGSGEVLVDGVHDFVRMLKDAGVPAEVLVADDQQHVYPVMAGHAPEADAAVHAMAEFVARFVPTIRDESTDAPA